MLGRVCSSYVPQGSSTKDDNAPRAFAFEVDDLLRVMNFDATIGVIEYNQTPFTCHSW